MLLVASISQKHRYILTGLKYILSRKVFYESGVKKSIMG